MNFWQKTGLLFGLTFLVSFVGVGFLPAVAPRVQKIASDAYAAVRMDAPKTLVIAKLGVKATVEQVGVAEDGRMAVPGDVWNVGWFNRGAVPGKRGNAVVAGHLDSKTGPAVFARLGELKRGDAVVLKTRLGKEMVFEVVKTAIYPDDNFPLEEVFGVEEFQKNLQLITCRGQFDRKAQEYSDRLVVYTRLVE